jgi:hypothetical protein
VISERRKVVSLFVFHSSLFTKKKILHKHFNLFAFPILLIGKAFLCSGDFNRRCNLPYWMLFLLELRCVGFFGFCRIFAVLDNFFL